VEEKKKAGKTRTQEKRSMVWISGAGQSSPCSKRRKEGLEGIERKKHADHRGRETKRQFGRLIG